MARKGGTFLVERRVPRGLAAALVLLGGLAGLGGVLTFVIITFVNGLPALQAQLSTSIGAGAAWLTDGPLQLSPQQLSAVRDQLLATLSANQAGITVGALTTAASDPDRDAAGAVHADLLPARRRRDLAVPAPRDALDGAWPGRCGGAPQPGRAGRYIRATAAVAVVDAVGIGIGLIVLGVPLAVPLAALVFLSAFIPILGPVLAGGVAVLIALVAQGGSRRWSCVASRVCRTRTCLGSRP